MNSISAAFSLSLCFMHNNDLLDSNYLHDWRSPVIASAFSALWQSGDDPENRILNFNHFLLTFALPEHQKL